jgi:amidase
MSDGATDLALLPALELRRLIDGRGVSASEVAAACLARIKAADPSIQSFVTLVDEERVMAAAENAQKQIRQGAASPLAGIPYALKDLTETAGIRTTFGSRLRENHVPNEDAAVARRLREAGGVLLGKTNTPEFGNRATTAFGLFPATHNPWDLVKTAGGSSGGSAAAVAACLCPVAEGSDGGGSIRIPSSCCGVVGIKPSRGRVSNAPNSNPRGGLITHGPIARTVADAAMMLDIMAGYEPGDPFVAPPHVAPFLSFAKQDPKPLKIGLLVKSDKPIDKEVVAAVQETAKVLVSLGHEVEEARVDITGLGPLFRVMAEAESAANEVEDPASFSDPYSTWCYRRGSELTAKAYIKATEEMFRRSREIIIASSKWDCLITPTVTLTPQPLKTFLAITERVAEDDLAYIPFTYPFNITGQPGISLPLGWSIEGLPIGVQLVGRPYEESLIISLAAQLERAMPWYSRYPARAAAPTEKVN